MAAPVKDTIASLRDINVESFKDDEERVAATKVLRSLLGRIERPVDQFYRITWMEPAYATALKTCVDTDLFTKWVAEGSVPSTAAQLSKLCGIEESLLTRLLLHMVAMNGLTQPELGSYGLTPLTASLAGDGFKNNIGLLYSMMYPGFVNLPSFLSKTNYKEPSDPKSTNWQDLHQKPETYVEWIGADPARIQQFHKVMQAYKVATPEWVDLYPTENLLKESKSGRALVVDIGGSKGGDLLSFQKKHPNLPANSLILQDLPYIIETLQAPPGVTAQAQNMFDPQQIKGARAYYMHFVLHGFNDEQCLVALKHLVAVMERGYSKLLLHEHVIDEEQPAPTGTCMDLTMMMTMSASERTKSQWLKLIEGAGLKLTNIYSKLTTNESIIEAELA